MHYSFLFNKKCFFFRLNIHQHRLILFSFNFVISFPMFPISQQNLFIWWRWYWSLCNHVPHLSYFSDFFLCVCMEWEDCKRCLWVITHIYMKCIVDGCCFFLAVYGHFLAMSFNFRWNELDKVLCSNEINIFLLT